MVLVFIEQENGKIKKSSIEAAFYAAQLAKSTADSVSAVALGQFAAGELESLGAYGVPTVHYINQAALNHFDGKLYAAAIAEVANRTGAGTIVISNHYSGKGLAGRLSVKLKAGIVSGATALPDAGQGNSVSKNVFSGKGIAHVKVNSDKKIIALNPNSFPPQKGEGQAAIQVAEVTLPASTLAVKSVNKVSSSIPLSEAELVVSAGRGLKGPENWGMIEEMANILGAATACSRAVADVHWRPHHEHVGQTGLTIRPNLYIAIGISGAIQHLAGVNSSKVIVVINKDPEAPFFKAADYGIVGDAFEVVPKLNAALKKFKAGA